MKSKIIISICAIIILALAGVNVNVSNSLKKEAKVSGLILKNMKALSQSEGSNNNGGNQYYYTHLLGKPDDCILFKGVNASGQVVYSSSSADIGAGYTITQVGGIKELCPKNGNGCTVYSCRVTPTP